MNSRASDSQGPGNGDRRASYRAVAERRAAFAPHAKTLAARALDSSDLRELRMSQRLSDKAFWFEDQTSGRLAAVIDHEKELANFDRAMAFALALKGDRDLILVIPDEFGEIANLRLSCLRRDSRVTALSYQEWESQPVEMVVSKRRAHAIFHELGLRKKPMPANVSRALSRVPEVAEWANSRPNLISAPRSAYAGWQRGGELVLKVGPARGGTRVVAGQHGGELTQGTDEDGVFFVRTNEGLSPKRLAKIQERVMADIQRVDLEGGESKIEALFQANLAAGPLSNELGIRPCDRECPVWRGIRGSLGTRSR